MLIYNVYYFFKVGRQIFLISSDFISNMVNSDKHSTHKRKLSVVHNLLRVERRPETEI